MIDLLCMGRAAVDFYADQIGASLENASSFSKYVGGCPANIAIGASRLGLKTGMLSAVGEEAMGRFVRETLISEGVDVSWLHTKPGHLTGLVLLGIDPPDNFPLIFYRENCADMALDENDFEPVCFQQSRALLITGTHCSNEKIFGVTKKAAALAKEAGCRVILDIDYRPVLWGAAGHGEGEERYRHLQLVADRLGEIMPLSDLIVGTEEEILAASGEPTIGAALSHVREQTAALLVQKRGEKGCIAYPGEIDAPLISEPFGVKVFNVLGAGDAFMSGFLRGWLKECDLKTCCRLGNANGALVVTRHGCSPAMPYWDELQVFMSGSESLSKIEILHRNYSRKPETNEVYLLAIDHRTFFHGRDPQKVREFKQLVVHSLEDLNLKNSGVILDESCDTALPVFRCIEEPQKVPLKFLGHQEARLILNSWPKEHGVKVLSPITDCDDEVIGPLKQLYDACVDTHRQLLIEFVFPAFPRIADLVEKCYQQGIYPDWWKLPPIDDSVGWKHISETIRDSDPGCKGILLLGQNLPLKELVKKHQKIKQADEMIKGFAVGRTIWGDLAGRYFAGQIGEKEIQEQIKQNFLELIYGKDDTRASINSVSR